MIIDNVEYYLTKEVLDKLGYLTGSMPKKCRDYLKKTVDIKFIDDIPYYNKKEIDEVCEYIEVTCKPQECTELLEREVNGLLVKLTTNYLGVTRSGFVIKKLFKQYDKTVLEPYTLKNPTGVPRYFYSDISDVADNLVKDTFQIFNVDGSKYNVSSIRDLSLDILETQYYIGSQVAKLLSREAITPNGLIGRVPMVRLRLLYYIKKEVIDEALHLKNNSISLEELKDKINFEVKGIQVSKLSLMTYLVNEGSPVFLGRENLFTSHTLIPYEHIETVVTHYKRLSEYNACTSTFEKIKWHMKYSPLKNNKISQTLEYYNEFILERFKEKSQRTKERLKNNYIKLYDVMVSKLKSELKNITDEEYFSLNKYLIDYYDEDTRSEFNSFYIKILKINKLFNKVIDAERIESKTKWDVSPYDLERFLEMYAILLIKLEDQAWINKIATEGGLAAATLYIMTHFLIAWRMGDIKSLPFPSLNLLDIDSGEALLKLVQENHNNFTRAMGDIICKDVERKVKLSRKKAKKNKGNLIFYVSDSSRRQVGMLLAICEAHRRVRENMLNATNFKGIGASDTLIYQSSLSRKYTEEIFENRTDYLFEDKTFGNRKANKAFLTYIQDKSEEWGLGIGYLLDSIIRGHKLNEKLISETTQVYIKREINKTTVRLFAAGIFGGVKNKLLELANDDYLELSLDEKSEKIGQLKILPSDIEAMNKVLAERSSHIGNVLDKCLNVEYRKFEQSENYPVLRELMYGKYSYGKHEGTKCLLRAIKKANDDALQITPISGNFVCVNQECKSCFGCEYLLGKKLFLYEVSAGFNMTLDSLKSSTSTIDKMIHIHRIEKIYFPLIFEAIQSFGEEEVMEIIKVDNVTNMLRDEKKKLKLLGGVKC